MCAAAGRVGGVLGLGPVRARRRRPAARFTRLAAGRRADACGVRRRRVDHLLGPALRGRGGRRAARGFAQVAVGAEHACALAAGGRVTCWGARGAAGRPPAGRFTRARRRRRAHVRADARAAPSAAGARRLAGAGAGARPVAGPTSPSGATTRASSAAAARARCWGAGGERPRRAAPAAALARVAAGSAHTCGVLRGGGLACWGANASGQAIAPGAALHRRRRRRRARLRAARRRRRLLGRERARARRARPAGASRRSPRAPRTPARSTVAQAVTCWGVEHVRAVAGAARPVHAGQRRRRPHVRAAGRRARRVLGRLARRPDDAAGRELRPGGGRRPAHVRADVGRPRAVLGLQRLLPAEPAAPATYTRIAAGGLHTCALTACGRRGLLGRRRRRPDAAAAGGVHGDRRGQLPQLRADRRTGRCAAGAWTTTGRRPPRPAGSRSSASGTTSRAA